MAILGAGTREISVITRKTIGFSAVSDEIRFLQDKEIQTATFGI